MTQAVYSMNDRIKINEILTRYGLDRFSTVSSKILSNKLSATISNELIKALFEIVVQQDFQLTQQQNIIKKQGELLIEKNLSVKNLSAMVFGSQSEKAQTLPKVEPDVDNDVKPEENTVTNNNIKTDAHNKQNKLVKVPKKYKKHPSRKRISHKLHREPIVHDASFNCPKCNKLYKETNMFDISEELAAKLMMYVLEHKRMKLLQDCDCQDVPKIHTCHKVGSVQYKGKYSTNLICMLLMNKFYMQVPIHRQLEKLFNNYGSELRESTINGLFKTLHKDVFPQLYTELKKKALEGYHFFGDETSWKVFVDKQGRKTFNHWIWVIAGKDAIVYLYDPTRSKSVILRTFSPNAFGIINVDRYASYNALPENVKRSFCWYHMRRDYIRLARAVPQLRLWALKWLKSIRKIEKLNNKRFTAYTQINDQDDLSDTFIRFHKRLCTILQAFYNRANRELENEDLNPLAYKVLNSLKNHWDGYIIFCEYPFVPMHNNYSERLLRQIANARNNFLGSHATWSAELMAMVLSISETAKLHNLNPHAYMEWFLDQCSKYDDRQIPNIQSVLPWNIDATVLDPYTQALSLIPPIYRERSAWDDVVKDNEATVISDINSAFSTLDINVYKDDVSSLQSEVKAVKQNSVEQITKRDLPMPIHMRLERIQGNTKCYEKNNLSEPLSQKTHTQKVISTVLTVLMLLLFIAFSFEKSIIVQEIYLLRATAYAASEYAHDKMPLFSSSIPKNRVSSFKTFFADTS